MQTSAALQATRTRVWSIADRLPALAVLMLGLVFPGWLLAVGVIALILTLVGWLTDANREFGRTVGPPNGNAA